MTPAIIACIGSRETPPPILKWMEETGADIVRLGCTLITGNAPGADQAWARGGNAVDPAKVTLCLPWEGFETPAVDSRNVVRIFHPRMHRRQFTIAESVHPAWSRMTFGGQRLHARNVLIVEGAKMVLGYVSHGGGGTAGAFRAAKLLGVPCVDVRDRDVRERVMGMVQK